MLLKITNGCVAFGANVVFSGIDFEVNKGASLSLTTIAFAYSSIRWFEACTCIPAPKGLPSSFM